MNSSKIFLVIATKDRVELLKRTLASIADCLKPDNFGGVVIIENGPVPLLEQWIKGPWLMEWAHLNIQYSYQNIANKSRAINSILERYRGHYLYFLDDDVRIDRNTVIEMSRAISSVPDNVYFGGPVEIDYESPPPAWLVKYLPWSATGFRLTENQNSEGAPNFLGANWLAKADDLIRVGGFTEFRGPCEIASGQETEMEIALKQAGHIPYYVKKAIVWHYVPGERCTPDWALDRVLPHSAAIGISAVDADGDLSVLSSSLFGFILNFLMAFVLRSPGKEEKKYHYRYRVRANWGKIRGIHYRWKYGKPGGNWRVRALLRLCYQLFRPLLNLLHSIKFTFLGLIDSIFVRRDPIEFSLALAKHSKLHKSALPFSIYTTSLCGLHCAHCIMLDQMKAQADYHMSLEEIERFLLNSQKSGYRFDIVLTGGEPLIWKNFHKGVEMIKNSPVCNSLRLFTNAMDPDRLDPVTAGYFDEIRISRYRENLEQALQLWKKYPSVVKIVSRTEFWEAPKDFSESRLPADCLNPEQLLFKDRIYACPHSESISTHRKLALQLSNPLEPGFLKGVAKIRRKQERDICAYCISNAKVRKTTKKVNNFGLRGWKNLNPIKGFSSP